MPRVALTGAATINGVIYSRDQLTSLFGLAGMVDYNSRPGAADVLYTSSAAIAKDTTKLRAARSNGVQVSDYSALFNDIAWGWTRHSSIARDTEALRDLRNIDFKFLHELRPGVDVPRGYPLTQVSKWARNHELVVMVRASTAASYNKVSTLIISGGVPLLIVHCLSRYMLEWVNAVQFASPTSSWLTSVPATGMYTILVPEIVWQRLGDEANSPPPARYDCLVGPYRRGLLQPQYGALSVVEVVADPLPMPYVEPEPVLDREYFQAMRELGDREKADAKNKAVGGTYHTELRAVVVPTRRVRVDF